MRPVAVAKALTTSDLIVAYHKRINTIYTRDNPGLGYMGADTSLICFRHSSNGGVSFGSEKCGSSVSGTLNFEAVRGGLTAAYDPLSDRFLIGFIGRGFTTANKTAIHVWTFARTGSLATQSLTSYTDAGSLHAPAIACSGLADGCRVVYEAEDHTGCTKLFKASVNTSGLLVRSGAISTSCSITALYDTPTTVYSSTTSQFLTAIMGRSDIIKAFSLTSTGTSYSARGTVWQDFSSYVSAPVIGLRSGKPQIWFLKYR